MKVDKKRLINVGLERPMCYLLADLDQEKINFNELPQFDFNGSTYENFKSCLEKNKDTVVVAKNLELLENVEVNKLLNGLLNDINKDTNTTVFFVHNKKSVEQIHSSLYRMMMVVDQVFEYDLNQIPTREAIQELRESNFKLQLERVVPEQVDVYIPPKMKK